MFEFAQRLKKLPPYLFAELDRKKREKLEEGVDVIDLGVGDPDLPTPEPVVESCKRALEDPKNHKYPSYEGLLEFREAVANWYKRRFGVSLDPEREVIALIGSKEGIAHLPLAFVEEGDFVLCPSPAYPVYSIGTTLAGGEPIFYPLKEENYFLPDLNEIPEEILKRTKILWINYPNNPTSVSITLQKLEEIVEFCRRYNIILASDLAYSEIYFGEVKPPSVLQVEGAKEVCIEFHSLSKTYNMTGWRIGMAVGNPKLVEGLGKVKTNVDSGQFNAIQVAGITALNLGEEYLKKVRETYKERRLAVEEALEKVGIEFIRSNTTFYLWAKVPKGFDSVGFVSYLIEKCGIVCTPGSGFGKEGEGYFRISLTVPTQRLLEAVERIKANL